MTTMSTVDKSLSKDPSEVIPITGVPYVPERSYQTPSEGNVSGSSNGGDGDVFQAEGGGNIFQVEGEEEVESPGIVVDEPGLSPPMKKRQKFKLSDLNVSKPKKKVVSTFFGTARTFDDIKWLERIYLLISLISIFASVGVTIDRMVDLRGMHSNSTANSTKDYDHYDRNRKLDILKADYTFAILLLWTAAFSLYHVLAGVISERAYDIVVYMVSTTIIWVYVVINYVQSDDRTDGKLARLIVTSCFGPFILGVGVILCRRYYQSSNFISYTLGVADSTFVKMYSTLLLHDSILKFDIQMGGSVLILWVQKSFIEPNPDNTEVVVIIVGVLITIFWATQAYLAIRLENIYLVYSFYASSFLEPAVVIFNIVRTALIADGSVSLQYSAYACGSIALISRALSVYTMYIVSQNFGKGLKALIFKPIFPETNTNTNGNAN